MARSPHTKPGAHSESRHTAVAVAVAITALAPFIQPEGLGVGPYMVRFAGILVSACVWFWAWALDPGSFRFDRRLVLAAAAVAAATLIASVASQTPGIQLTFGADGSMMSAPTWIALLAVFVFCASVKPSPRVVSMLQLVFVWGAYSAARALWQRAAGSGVTAGFGNSNYVSAALVTLIPLALLLANSDANARWRQFWRYLSFALIAAVLLAGSLSGVVALGAAFVGMCLLAPGPLLGISPAAGKRAAVVLAVCAALLASLAGLTLLTGVLPKPIDEAVGDRLLGPTAQTRLQMWGMAAAVFADHPLAGVGPDGLTLASQGYLTERLVELESGAYSDYRVLLKDPHSLPMLVLSSLGLVGFAALVWLAFEWLTALRRAAPSSSTESRTWALRCALAIGVGAHLTALMFMPWAVAFGPLVSLFAGIAISGRAGSDAFGGSDCGGFVRAVTAAAATVLVVGLVGTAAYGDFHVQRAGKQSSPDLARDAYAAAARVQPTRPYPAYEALYAQGFLASDGLASIADYRAAVDAADPLVTANAGFLANLVQPSLDEAYLSGRTDIGWEGGLIERAAEAAPNHPDVVLEEAHVALLSGDIAVAKAILNRARRLSPNAPRYLLYSYYLALATGDEKAAEALMPRIEASGPGHSRLAKGWSR